MTISYAVVSVGGRSRGASARRVPCARLAAGVVAVVVLCGVSVASVERPLRHGGSVVARGTSARAAAGVPVSLQALASRVIGASERRLWVSDRGGRMSAAGGGVVSAFARSGVTVRVGAGAVRLRLLGIGHGRRLQAVAGASPVASRNSVYYQRGAVSEWYRNGPYGLEQGFTLSRRPAGEGPLTVALGIGGTLQARQAGAGVVFARGDGAPVLRYGELRVLDARGRELPARVILDGRTLELRVEDRGARYPLRIDPFIQQGAKLVPDDETRPGGAFGFSVALSANGETALIGGPDDGEGKGAAWVFTRVGATWTEQGPKLVASGEIGPGGFGYSVALSTDGSTAVIGAPVNDGYTGAAYVFTRTGASWNQQAELEGQGEVGGGEFGGSVALSGDGNTALIGGSADSLLVGAAWVFTRSGSTWSQQGPKLTASGESGRAQFGLSVALSEDGETALVGGPGNVEGEVDGVGAAWVFTRSGSTWSQQAELTGEGEDAPSLFGWSVAVSAHGETALVGAPKDDGSVGAAWVFTRSGSTWSQQGPKLTASGESGQGELGWTVGCSADGSTALLGGPNEGEFVGAAWVFIRAGSTWSQQAKLTGTGEVDGGDFGESVALSASGETALIGGSYENDYMGAAWVFTGADSVWGQQAKLTGVGETGVNNSMFATSVAISETGETAVIGGPIDNEGHGAAWVFTRSGTSWSQQAKLVGSTETGPSGFGTSVAVSANGNTALIGGPHNANGIGAAWVFTRKGNTWTQQGSKLLASGTSGFVEFAASVALSKNGSTALVGGPGRDAPTGAAWVFTRAGSTWTQQAKLTGSGESGRSEFGQSVALSANATTALVGGPGDDKATGAAWVFTRSGSTWTQQGSKLLASGERGAAGFADSVALSANGNTAVLGGPGDDGDVGAAWVFTRSGSTWSQQGSKLTGQGEVGPGLFGESVSVAGKGTIALVGGWNDNSAVGAAWVFTRKGSTWHEQGAKLTGSEESGQGDFGAGVALSRNGSTALVGGPGDDENVGAAWVFTASE